MTAKDAIALYRAERVKRGLPLAKPTSLRRRANPISRIAEIAPFARDGKTTRVHRVQRENRGWWEAP